MVAIALYVANTKDDEVQYPVVKLCPIDFCVISAMLHCM